MRTEIVMPKAGLTMIEGTISQWLVKEGELVQKNQAIMEYENEKNTIEYEIVRGGYLHILAAAGDTVPVGKPIALVTDTKEEYDALLAELSGEAAGSPDEAAPLSAPAPAEIQGRKGGRHFRATGLARKMARQAGIDLADVTPASGPDGRRIAAKDVTAYLEKKKAASEAAAVRKSDAEDEVTVLPWTGMRRTIARNMYNSLHQTAQCTAMCETDVTELLLLRQQLLDGAEYLGCRITVNDLLCAAVCKVMRKYPQLNGTFDGEAFTSHSHVQLSLAVATDHGLMVPVIKNADTLSLTQLSLAAKDLSRRAREKKLQAGEQGCGTVTVSNVGMFPIDMSTPILNTPEVLIFGFGRTTRKPRYTADGSLAPRELMQMYLTFDHQVVDGLAVGNLFQDMQYLLEHPQLITV